MIEQAFAGVRVVELAQYVFVPSAGALLADHGAEVIHVETVEGDPYRVFRSGAPGSSPNANQVNFAMEQNNRGKKSIAIDLKTEAGREVLLKLIENADIFLTSLRPKAITGLRLDVADLRARNPKLIYARGNGLGFKGAEIDKAGYDASAFWSRGGFAHILRAPGTEAPVRPRPALGDHTGGLALAYGMASALYKRAMTGEPSVVDVSLLGTAMWVLSSDVVNTQMQTPEQQLGMGVTMVNPMTANYRTRDGRWIQLMLLQPDRYYAPLCRMLALDALIEDPRFATPKGRATNAQALLDLFTARVAEEDWALWKPIFGAWDAPWELVQTPHEVAQDPMALANGHMFEAEAGNGQRIKLATGPIALDGEIAPREPKGAPALGADTEELLAAAGIDADARAKLRTAGTIR